LAVRPSLPAAHAGHARQVIDQPQVSDAELDALATKDFTEPEG
jgi:hypothetical protein